MFRKLVGFKRMFLRKSVFYQYFHEIATLNFTKIPKFLSDLFEEVLNTLGCLEGNFLSGSFFSVKLQDQNISLEFD